MKNIKLNTWQKMMLVTVAVVIALLLVVGQAQAWSPSFVVRTVQYPMGSSTVTYRTTIEDRVNNVFADIVHTWTPCGEKVFQPSGTVLSLKDGSKIGTFRAHTVRQNEIYLSITLTGESTRTVVYSITKTLAGDAVYYSNTAYINNQLTTIRARVLGGLVCYCPATAGHSSPSAGTVRP